MLEKIDLSKKADKETFKQVMETEGGRLAGLQRECKAAGIPVMIVFEGMGAAGKGVQINRLIQAEISETSDGSPLTGSLCVSELC